MPADGSIRSVAPSPAQGHVPQRALEPHLADALAKVEAKFGSRKPFPVPHPNYGPPADPVGDYDPEFEHGTWHSTYRRRTSR